jgi:hypothetical protein
VNLSRRDALAALGAVGAVGATGAMALAGRGAPRADDGDAGEADAHLPASARDVLVAAADVLYPSAVEEHRAFVETYALGRTADRPAYRAGVRAAAEAVDEAAREWYDAGFADLSPADRDALLRELGTDTAEPDPEGTVSERVRYYVVNDLLFALYASPPGGRLVGIENPVGYPGGIASYRRGPDGERVSREDVATGADGGVGGDADATGGRDGG